MNKSKLIIEECLPAFAYKIRIPLNKLPAFNLGIKAIYKDFRMFPHLEPSDLDENVVQNGVIVEFNTSSNSKQYIDEFIQSFCKNEDIALEENHPTGVIGKK